MRKLWGTGAALALLVAGAGTAAATGASSAPEAAAGARATVTADVVEREVAFTVRNVNRTDLACRTDGRKYTVRGTVVGPRGAIDRAHAATLYLHGLELGQWFWTLDAEGASYVERQAAAGHVSVVVDRLGYDASGKPPGKASCLGGQADVTHQIVDQLKSGRYDVTSEPAHPAAYDRVAVAGHSFGGLLAQMTAYSFGNVDAVGVISYSDKILSKAGRQAAAANARTCAAGGMPTEGSSPGGYAFFAPTNAAFRASFFSTADPDVVDQALELRNRNPCGDTGSFNAAKALDLKRVEEVDVPVIVIIGARDAVFPPPSGRSQAALFTGSDDVTLEVVPRASHAITLEETAPRFAAEMSRWLSERGF